MNKSIKEALQSFALQQALHYVEGNPEENIPKLMDLVDRFSTDRWYTGQRSAVRKAIEEKSNWYQLILRFYELNPEVRKAFFQNFLFNASLRGSAIQNEVKEREGCNVPWAILLDPTSACNLHCTGCWAAEYGRQLNLSLETMDSIIRQGKELGVYMYIYTGGEPLVRKADLLRLCEMHPDCEFLSFTNGTLIDRDFCQELLRVKNFKSGKPWSCSGNTGSPSASPPATPAATAAMDYQSPESVDHLCDKTTPYAEAWKTAADRLWPGCAGCASRRCGK